MVRSMIAGVAGLRAHQSKMDVIGNNIANVNTWGFKSYSYNFADSMYTTSINSAGGNVTAGASGGRNASQVGYGSKLSSISNVFENGAPSPSSREMDCMIDGTGFFLVGSMVNGSFTNVKDSGLYLSRVGIFSVDENGYLVDDQRNYVYGYAVQEGTGTPEKPATAATVKLANVPITLEPATGQPNSITINGIKVGLSGNIKSESDVEDAVQEWVKYVTNSNNQQPNKTADDGTTEKPKPPIDAAYANVKIDFNNVDSRTEVPEDTTANPPVPKHYDWTVSLTLTSVNTGENSRQNLTPVLGETTNNGVTTVMDGGTIAEETPGTTWEPSVPAIYSSELSTIQIPIDPSTGMQYELQSYKVNGDGTITGVDKQNHAIALGKVALIAVENPNGLEKTDGYYYTFGANVGEVTHEEPGTGPTGSLKGSYLEMANVDLANEFSNIITTQRGFQANSKIITVTDEMLQELVNMKR